MLNIPRILAGMRSRQPVLVLLAGMLPGQVAAHCFPPLIVLPVLSVILLCIYGLRRWLRSARGQAAPGPLFSSFLLGLLSMWSAIPERSFKPMDETSYLVQVDAPVRRRRVGEKELSLLITGRLRPDLSSLEMEESPKPIRVMCKAIDLPWVNISAAEEGSFLIVRARFRGIDRHNPLFSYQATLLRRGYSATCRIVFASPVLHRESPLLGGLRASLEEAAEHVLGDGEASGLLLSVALGTRDRLSQRTEEAFKATGLAHVLVFSGYQISIVYLLVLQLAALLLRATFSTLPGPWIRLSTLAPLKRQFALLSTGPALLLACIAGLDGAAVRALTAVAVSVAATVSERGAGMLRGIAAALLVTSMVWPGSFLEPGMQLTYAALAGIWVGAAAPHGWRRFVLISFAVWVFTSVVVMAWFKSYPWLGLFLNPLFAPLFSIVGCCGGLVVLFGSAAGFAPAEQVLHPIAWILTGLRDAVLWTAEWAPAVQEPGVLLGVSLALLHVGVGLALVGARLSARHRA